MPTLCSGNTCDQTSMLDIPYGEALSMLGGAVYRCSVYHFLHWYPGFMKKHGFSQFVYFLSSHWRWPELQVPMQRRSPNVWVWISLLWWKLLEWIGEIKLVIMCLDLSKHVSIYFFNCNCQVPVCLVAPAPPALELLVDGVPQTVVCDQLSMTIVKI